MNSVHWKVQHQQYVINLGEHYLPTNQVRIKGYWKVCLYKQIFLELQSLKLKIDWWINGFHPFSLCLVSLSRDWIDLYHGKCIIKQMRTSSNILTYYHPCMRIVKVSFVRLCACVCLCVQALNPDQEFRILHLHYYNIKVKFDNS